MKRKYMNVGNKISYFTNKSEDKCVLNNVLIILLMTQTYL